MKTITFTEFRKHASELVTEVENGTTLLLVRHGKPVAEITPVADLESRMPSWRTPGVRLVARGIPLSRAILEERESGQ
jgi:prevent-host-death family protein